MNIKTLTNQYITIENQHGIQLILDKSLLSPFFKDITKPNVNEINKVKPFTLQDWNALLNDIKYSNVCDEHNSQRFNFPALLVIKDITKYKMCIFVQIDELEAMILIGEIPFVDVNEKPTQEDYIDRYINDELFSPIGVWGMLKNISS